MTLGERIAKCRKDKNLSQEYVAERLEVSRQAVSKWENDLNAPDTYNLIALAKLFGVSFEYLACGEEQDKDDDTKQETHTESKIEKATVTKPLENKKPRSLVSRLICLFLFGITFVIFLFFRWVTPINLLLILIMIFELYGILGN